MNDAIYWIWLQQTVGYSNIIINSIYENFGSARRFYEGGEDVWRTLPRITPNILKRMNSVSLRRAAAVLHECEMLEICVLTPEMDEYPQAFRDIVNMPAVVYVQGQAEALSEEFAVTIVGTRKASPQGQRAAYVLARSLARAGAMIVSGYAYGIDSCAHLGALDGEGKTIAVLGCGLNYVYNTENSEMRKRIVENGAVISEYPPDFAPSRTTFPLRNRLLAALSPATVVVEAAAKSGALITASEAAEQGKDVFALPGDISNRLYDGCNSLIRDGAQPIECAFDVIEDYLPLFPHKVGNLESAHMPLSRLMQMVPAPDVATRAPKSRASRAASDAPSAMVASPVKTAVRAKPAAKNVCSQPALVPLPAGCSEIYALIYAKLKRGDMHFDELYSEVEASSGELMATLSAMEIDGIVQSLPGRRYKICSK